jgi:hypothetical protein
MTTTLMVLAMFFPTAGEQPPDYKPRHRGCNTRACDKRVDRKIIRKRTAAKRRYVAPFRGKLLRIATCESGQRWHIATGNGFYGGLQFTVGTWLSAGGRGMPHWHTSLEQMYRAVIVYKRRGSWADWPVCGFR